MKGISCEVIKDLLPLYHDEVCSAESVKTVEAHLAECRDCSLEWEKLKSSVHLPKEEIAKNYNEAAAIKGISAVWRRSKVKSLSIGLLAAAFLFGGYIGLSQWDIMKVPADVIHIAEVSKLPDGRVVYHATLTDGYTLNRIDYDMDEEGNFYLTPLRPVIKTKALSDRRLEIYDTFDHESHVYKEKYGEDAEIKAIYYKTSSEDILIWKKGMDLPAASEAVEEEFHSK